MPSRKKTNHKPQSHTRRKRAGKHSFFFPLLILSFIFWIIYRAIFAFPVWFDESIGKAIFFGLPVWLYLNATGFEAVKDTVALEKLKPGLLKGLAIGGLFGFFALFIRILQGATLQAAPLFLSDQFWYEFGLAILTGFWETIFFFSWIMVVIQDRFKKWTLAKQAILVSIIFLLFHIPNTFLRFDIRLVASMLGLLFLFALGQSLIFARKQNAYTLILSQAIWGMALLVYF